MNIADRLLHIVHSIAAKLLMGLTDLVVKVDLGGEVLFKNSDLLHRR